MQKSYSTIWIAFDNTNTVCEYVTTLCYVKQTVEDIRAIKLRFVVFTRPPIN